MIQVHSQALNRRKEIENKEGVRARKRFRKICYREHKERKRKINKLTVSRMGRQLVSKRKTQRLKDRGGIEKVR